jgi:hypothetical protein
MESTYTLFKEASMAKKYHLLFAAIALILIASPALAQPRPIQIALVTPVQIFPEDESITGVRWNILYGRNVTVRGLDFGLINHTTGGLSKGVQLGLVGVAESDFLGWQHNYLVNYSKGDFEGFQWGFFNYAGQASGFQLGFFNYAGSMHGLQVGLINVIDIGGAFPVFPIVNWSFN